MSLTTKQIPAKRKFFEKQVEVIPLPNFIETQVFSYNWFLREGLRDLLDEIFVKLQKKYRFHIIIKCDCIKTMSEVINYFKSQIKLKYKVSYSIDVDPLSLL